MPLLSLKHISASIDQKELLHHISLSVNTGEVHVVMGANGSGKSTLAKIIAGHPTYHITKGSIIFEKEDITTMSPDKRANKGLFLSFQSPQTIKGLSLQSFFKTIYNTHQKELGEKALSIFEFRDFLQKEMKKLHISVSLENRHVNDGFSGGEMKKLEILQMNLLAPKLAILDEIDSGLDVDALKIVSSSIKDHLKKRDMAIILITHSTRLLSFLTPTKVHVMADGQIIASGDKKLVREIEKKGFCGFCQETRKGLRCTKMKERAPIAFHAKVKKS